MSVDVSSPSLSDVLHAMLRDPRTVMILQPRPRNFQGTPTPPHKGASPMSTYAQLNARATAETGHALSTIVGVLSPRDRVLLRGLWKESCPAVLGNLPTLLNVYAWLAHEHDVAQGRARHFAKLGPETAAESTRRARHCARAMAGVHDQIQQIIAADAAGEA